MPRTITIKFAAGPQRQKRIASVLSIWTVGSLSTQRRYRVSGGVCSILREYSASLPLANAVMAEKLVVTVGDHLVGRGVRAR